MLGCQHCLLTLAKGPCSGAQCEFEKEMGNALECDWRRPCLEIRLKVSVMSPIIRQCARGVRSESETGERSRRRPQSLSSSSSCSASLSQAQLKCILSAPRVPRCCVRPSSPPDSTTSSGLRAVIVGIWLGLLVVLPSSRLIPVSLFVL